MDATIGLIAGVRAEVSRQLDAIAAESAVRVVEVLGGDASGASPSPRSVQQILVVDGCPSPAGTAGAGGLGELERWVPGGADRERVVVVHLAGEEQQAREAADRVGAAWVVELPQGGPWLVDLAVRRPDGPVLAVVGAVGGAGATTVALACAAAAGPGCLLVDADPWSAGLDLPLGIHSTEAGRWSSVPDTDEPLVAESLRAALPSIQGITVVTGAMPTPAGGRVPGVLGVGRAGFRRTVVDCGRSAANVPLDARDVLVVVTPATLAGVVAARRAAAEASVGRVLLAVRPLGWLPIDEVADRLEVAVALELPRLRRLAESIECGEVLSGRAGRDLARLGDRIWAAAS